MTPEQKKFHEKLGDEEWKPLNVNGRDIEVSNKGRVRTVTCIIDRKIGGKYERIGRVLKPKINTNGYHIVTIHKNSKSIIYQVHRLVLRAFVGESNLKCDHINGIRTDNRIENLEYVTQRENVFRGVLRRNGSVGVYEDKRRKTPWCARIRGKNGNSRHLGYFKTKEEAEKAYQKAYNEIERPAISKAVGGGDE